MDEQNYGSSSNSIHKLTMTVAMCIVEVIMCYRITENVGLYA